MLLHTLLLITTVLSAHLQAFMFDALFLVKIKHISSQLNAKYKLLTLWFLQKFYSLNFSIINSRVLKIYHPKRGTLIYYYTLENRYLI